jgi:hypothetical protein
MLKKNISIIYKKILFIRFFYSSSSSSINNINQNKNNYNLDVLNINPNIVNFTSILKEINGIEYKFSEYLEFKDNEILFN